MSLQSLRQPLGTFANETPHPSRGGNSYSDDMKEDVIMRWQMGIPLVSPELDALRAVHAYPHIDTCMRYIRQFHDHGHTRRKKATGNHPAEREILGQPLVRLALFRCVHPEGTIDHARAYLYNCDPSVLPYSPSQLCRADHLLDLRRKAASTTCERAFWDINLRKRHRFWTMNYPFGRANIRTCDMIDMDEAGFKIESTNTKFGKAVSWLRVWTEGQYLRDKKLNCMMAISADANYNMEWHDVWSQDEGGTDLYRVYVFFERIINQLAVERPNRSFCFTMDNLNTHHHPMILDLITSNGHKYLFRAPYWSVDGPMEYVFNTIHTLLLAFYNQVQSLDDLDDALDLIIDSLTNFQRYFFHVNFPNT